MWPVSKHRLRVMPFLLLLPYHHSSVFASAADISGQVMIYREERANLFATMKRLLILWAIAGLAAGLLTAQSAEKEKKTTKIDTSKLPPPSTKEGVTYASDIKPIFDKPCIKCHGDRKSVV